MSQQKSNKSIQEILEEYRVNIENELKKRWNSWDIDISQKQIYEVIGGLVTRQVIIMKHFSLSPNMWNPDLGPIILRTLIDNFFTLAWICDDPLDRSQKYIYHGLGADKLNMANRAKQMKEEGNDPDKDPLIKMSNAWAESQRYRFLTEVNFGSWSGLSTRQMAEQSGNIGLYNYSFQPFSSVAHNMWNHIGQLCMRQSSNPLHQLLHIPDAKKYPPMPFVLDIGANYLDRSFQRIDKLFPTGEAIVSSYETLLEEFEKLTDEEE